MGNPYDSAHALAKDLSESSEYKELKSMGEKIKASPELLHQLKEFSNMQLELEFQVMSGVQPDEEKMKKLEELYKLISLNQEGLNFLENKMKFHRLVGDIMKIVNERITDVTEILKDE